MAVVLIVGADKGIANRLCHQYQSMGDRVIAACLFDARDLRDAGIEVIADVDVTSDVKVAAMVKALREKDTQLDIVINVAGVLGLDQLGDIDYEDVRRQIEINTIGPLRIIESIVPLLSAGSKVGIVTSRVGSLQDNTSGGMYAYRVSKAGANMVGLNLHHDLSPHGIAVLMLHPGMVATDLTKDFPGDFDYITPDEAASGFIQNMDALTLENSGKFQHSNGEFLPW